MYRLYKQNDDIQAYVTEFVADTDDDIKDLPTSVYHGSVCIVVASSNVYILNAYSKWILLS